MKIGLDVRNISKEHKKFTYELIQQFLRNFEDHRVFVYSCQDFDDISTISSSKYTGLFQEQFLFLKRLKDDKNDIVITFNDTFPILYKQKYIQVLPSLEKLFYPNVESSKSSQKHTYQFLLKNSLKNAERIICFDEKAKKDINEKINISEEKIEIIPGFFYQNQNPLSDEIKLFIDIKQRHSISGEYIIYDSDTGSNKNIKRLLEALIGEDLYLIFIGNNISRDLEVREMILKLNLKEKVIFAGFPEQKELSFYYEQSLGVIYPLLYSSFPFSLNKAILFGTQIICSDLEELQNIFGKNAIYFSPISTLELKECFHNILSQKNKKIDYTDICKKYNSNDFINNLKKICQI